MTVLAATDFTAALAERELTRRAGSGDASAQRKLYEQHVDRVYRLAFRMTGDSDMAADVTQETFIRAFDRMDGFRHDSAFGTWLYRIAVTTALSALRSWKRRQRRYVPMTEAAELAQNPDESDTELRARVHAAIDALPDGYRTVFVMYELEGYSHQEIADALGVSVSTSKGQLFRAKAKLRHALASIVGEGPRT